MLKSKCPAYGKTCKACNQKNHFSCSVKCHNEVNPVTDSNDDIHMVNIIHYITDKAIIGIIIVNNKPVKNHIDSGTSVNVLPEQYVSPADIQTTTTVLQMYNKSVVKPLCEIKVNVYNPANGHTSSVKFVSVPENSGLIHILGSKASQLINILTLNKNHMEPVLQLKLSNVMTTLMY